MCYYACMMSDDEIRDAIAQYFSIKLRNFRNEELYEGPCDFNEDVYDRACKLLEGATIEMRWKDVP